MTEIYVAVWILHVYEIDKVTELIIWNQVVSDSVSLPSIGIKGLGSKLDQIAHVNLNGHW